MIAVVDYGAGNLRSVDLALARLGAEAVITRDPDVMAGADGLILPGVGAFADAMAALENSGVVPALYAFAQSGRRSWGFAWECRPCSTAARRARASGDWG